MATLHPLQNHNYMIVVLALCLCHLLCDNVTATNNVSGNIGGFHAHLIRKDSPDSPWRDKNINNSRRLMSREAPGALIRTDPNSGAHIMKFSMGTPPFFIYAIADTGSNLLWTQCRPCKACYKSNYGIFNPSRSSTFKQINCRAKDCRLVSKFKPDNYEAEYCRENDKRPCLYSYSYADMTTTTGVLSKETITLSSLSRDLTVKDVIFGCGYMNNETMSTGNEMGVIGLGRGPLSFISQIGPFVGGKKLSHCLVTEDSLKVSSIFFGKGSEVTGEGTVTTSLVNTSPEEMSYFVTLTGLSIGKDFVSYNSTNAKLKKGNMVIDSGTPVTRLPQDFFDRIVAVLQRVVKLESFVKLYMPSSTSNLCFRSATVPKLPTVSVHFDGGGKLELAQKNLFYWDEENVSCFRMAKHVVDGIDFADVTIFGGSLQTNMLIGFDMEKHTVSFKPTNCDALEQPMNEGAL